MTRARRTALLTIPLGALLLAGCGSTEGPTVSGGTPVANTGSAPATDTSTGESSSSSESASSSTSSSSSSTTAAGTTESPSSILTATQTAANQATSAHIAGDVVDDGKKLNVDIRGTVDGKNQQVIVKTVNEGTISIVSVGGKHYVKGDRTYWSKQGAPASTVNLVADKYIVAPPKNTAAFEKFTIKKIITDMTNDLDPSKATAANTKITPTTEARQPALELRELGDELNVVTVAADPKHQALKVVSVSGVVRFSEWNAVPAYAAPPASQIVTPPTR